MKAERVITPDQVTSINDYGRIINSYADIIDKLSETVSTLEERIESLELYITNAERRRTFKKFVVIASSSECLAVLTDRFENFCDDIIHVNNSFDNVVYYRLNDGVLANGEVVFILKDFYEKWSRGKKHTVLTIEELEDRLSNGGLND